MSMRVFGTITALCLSFSGAAIAETKVNDKAEFMRLVKGKDLRLPLYGVTLKVKENGQISGKGFGKPVKGEWQWKGGYFCRSLFLGKKNLGDNCQLVETVGAKLRFTSDQGAGRSADFRVE